MGIMGGIIGAETGLVAIKNSSYDSVGVAISAGAAGGILTAFRLNQSLNYPLNKMYWLLWDAHHGQGTVLSHFMEVVLEKIKNKDCDSFFNRNAGDIEAQGASEDEEQALLTWPEKEALKNDIATTLSHSDDQQLFCKEDDIYTFERTVTEFCNGSLKKFLEFKKQNPL